jgi:hypothetical protein
MVLLPSSCAPVPVKNKMVLISTEKKIVQLRYCEKNPELNKKLRKKHIDLLFKKTHFYTLNDKSTCKLSC